MIKKLILRFWENKYQRRLRARVDKSKYKNLSEIETRINDLIETPDKVTESELDFLIQEQTSIEMQPVIIEFDLKRSKITKRAFDPVEVEFEITNLNRKIYDLKVNRKKIESISFPKEHSSDNEIKELWNILNKHNIKGSLKFSNSSITNMKTLWQGLEKKIAEKTVSKLFLRREADKAKQFKKFKQEIENGQSQINRLIDLEDFNPAKTAIKELEILLKSIKALSIKIVQGKTKENNKIVSNLAKRTADLKKKLTDKENQIEAQRQAKELKTLQEEAERKRLAEEAIREAVRKQREQEELIRKQDEEAKRRKEEEKKQQLQNLQTRKPNWQEFAQVLKENGIISLYHFTDKANIRAIKSAGGLYSWSYLEKEDIFVSSPGSGPKARLAALQFGLSDFISLSFIKDHPMKHVALKEGRISDPVTLEISIEVIFWEHTEFSTMNAADGKTSKGKSIDILRKCKFELFNKKYFDLEEDDKKYHQAEVLVKTWVPLEFINNIKKF